MIMVLRLLRAGSGLIVSRSLLRRTILKKDKSSKATTESKVFTKNSIPFQIKNHNQIKANSGPVSIVIGSVRCDKKTT